MDKNGKKCFISFGKCDKVYILIISGTIILILSIFGILLLLMNYIESLEKDEDKNVLNFISYLFFIYLGESLMVFPGLILKKNMSSKQSQDLTRKEGLNSIERYIYNKKTINFSKKEKIYFVLFGILKLVLEIIKYFFAIHLNGREQFFFLLFNYSFQYELLFLYIISVYIYHFRLYKHQYISIIILTLLGIAITITQYYDKGYDIIYVFLSDLIYSFFRSLFIVYIKGLMEFKYISPYKACFSYGLMNLIPIIIAFIISSFCPCENSSICLVVYNDQTYFAQILAIFKISSIFLFIAFLLKALITILNYITIRYLSVFHSFLPIYFLRILNIGSIGLNDSKINKMYIYIPVFIIGLFFILLFLEIIELNIFKFSYNSKKNIELRAILDANGDDDNCEEEEENEEIDKHNIELNIN